MDDRTLPIGECPMCGYQSEERYDNAMRTKTGEYIYRRGIRIIHRCMEDRPAVHQFDGPGADGAMGP